MRIISTDGRLGLLTGGGYLDVETASDGTFGADPQAVYDRWDSFLAWARVTVAASRIKEIRPVIDERLQAPVPRPRQVFAIGVNYRDHAAEAGHRPSGGTDGVHQVPQRNHRTLRHHRTAPRLGRLRSRTRRGHRPAAYRVPESGAWSYVAGLTIGQDLSERETQLRPPARSSTTSASPTPASLRSGRAWSPRTSSLTPMTWRSAAP